MILKRFETDNIHLDYMNKEIKKEEIINESSSTKLELLANISKNWNDDLSENFESIRSLYSKSKEELESINEKFLTIDEISVEENKIDKQLLIDTLAELNMKYGDNEAIDTIKIVENNIVFDILCETDIEKSVTEYNGIELVYNKICEIPLNESVQEIVEKLTDNTQIDDLFNDEYEDIINEKILISQSLYMTEVFSGGEITIDDLRFSKWFKYLKTKDYSTDFTIQFLYDIKGINISVNDAVFFLMHIFKNYNIEPTSVEYQKELDKFLSNFN